MTLSLRLCALLAALGLGGQLTAKPPDLPVNDAPILAPEDYKASPDGSGEQMSPPPAGGAIRFSASAVPEETAESLILLRQPWKGPDYIKGPPPEDVGYWRPLPENYTTWECEPPESVKEILRPVEELIEPCDSFLTRLDTSTLSLPRCSLYHLPLMRLAIEEKQPGGLDAAAWSRTMGWLSQRSSERLRQIVADTISSDLTFFLWDPVRQLYREQRSEDWFGPRWGKKPCISFRLRQSSNPESYSFASVARPRVLVLTPSKAVLRGPRTPRPCTIFSKPSGLTSLDVLSQPAGQWQIGSAALLPRGVSVALTPEALAAEGEDAPAPKEKSR